MAKRRLEFVDGGRLMNRLDDHTNPGARMPTLFGLRPSFVLYCRLVIISGGGRYHYVSIAYYSLGPWGPGVMRSHGCNGALALVF